MRDRTMVQLLGGSIAGVDDRVRRRRDRELGRRGVADIARTGTGFAFLVRSFVVVVSAVSAASGAPYGRDLIGELQSVTTSSSRGRQRDHLRMHALNCCCPGLLGLSEVIGSERRAPFDKPRDKLRFALFTCSARAVPVRFSRDRRVRRACRRDVIVSIASIFSLLSGTRACRVRPRCSTGAPATSPLL